MKKVLSIILFLLSLCVLICSCEKKPDTAEETTAAETTAAQTVAEGETTTAVDGEKEIVTEEIATEAVSKEDGETAAEEDLTTAEETTEEENSEEESVAEETTQEETFDLETLKQNAKQCLENLKAGFYTNAYDYLPEAMDPGYESNLVIAGSVDYSFNENVAISDVNWNGFGEQWHTVTENIAQSQFFYKYLDGIATVFNQIDEYLLSPYIESVDYSYESEEMSISFEYAEDAVALHVSYKTGVNIELLGEVVPTIDLTLDVKTGVETIRITVSDTNALKLSIAEDKYEFAMKIGVTDWARNSHLVIERQNNGKVTGYVSEFTTLSGVELEAGVDFYVEGDYVSVVGNKAVSVSCTNELYDKNTGRLLAFDVKTTVFDTLWFNLDDISGISSILVKEKSKENKSGNSTCDVYLNGSEVLFVPTCNNGIINRTRKYDVEMKKRYFYSWDEDKGKLVEHEVELPMMFIQEGDNLASYSEDMLKDNGIVSAVLLASNHLEKVQSDHETLIPAFSENKKNRTVADVDAFLQ